MGEGRIYDDYKNDVAWKGLETKTEFDDTMANFKEHGGFTSPGAFDKYILYERNAKWMDKLEFLGKETSPVLMLPGSGHLWGDGGMLSLLQQAGWETESTELLGSSGL